MSETSQPHSELVRRMRKALHEASYANTEDGLEALGELVEQYGELEGKYAYVVEAHGHWKELAERFDAEKNGLQEQLGTAVAFIEYMALEGRYAEWIDERPSFAGSTEDES